MDERRPERESDEWSLKDLSTSVLEEMLVDLMVAKYPGIEQADVERLLAALRDGDLGLVSHVEAGIALKSAQWLRAALSVEA
ncbi:MAG TPA: hypothetical protein VM366_00410 [Anaerolineae bacterium]|nr:hypothetical protein [Anaerolineae bacterium]